MRKILAHPRLDMSHTDLALQVQLALKLLSLRTRTTICRASLSDRLGIPVSYRNAPVFQTRVHNQRRHIRILASQLQIKMELSIQLQIALQTATTEIPNLLLFAGSSKKTGINDAKHKICIALACLPSMDLVPVSNSQTKNNGIRWRKADITTGLR
jgi:hypothetical protein